MATEEFRISSVIPASPNKVYGAWLDERKHSAFTGGRASIEPWVGGRHSAWDGYIEGMLVELDTGRRIVMTWRTTDFTSDTPMSHVAVHLDPIAGGTRVTIVHYDLPEDQVEQYKKGWRSNYLDPLRRFFSKPGAMRAAIRAARKAGRLPIRGVTSPAPGTVRPPTGPRPVMQKKTAKVATKKAAAKRAAEPKKATKKAAPKGATKKAAPKKATKKAAPKRATKKAAPKKATKKAAPKRATKKAAPKKATKRATKKAAKKRR